jgi:hypothetical protein
METNKNFIQGKYYARKNGRDVFKFIKTTYSSYGETMYWQHKFQCVSDNSIFYLDDTSEEEMRNVNVQYEINAVVPVSVKINNFFINDNGEVAYEIKAKNHYTNREIY